MSPMCGISSLHNTWLCEVLCKEIIRHDIGFRAGDGVSAAALWVEGMNVEWRRENEGGVSRDGCPDSRACV